MLAFFKLHLPLAHTLQTWYFAFEVCKKTEQQQQQKTLQIKDFMRQQFFFRRHTFISWCSERSQPPRIMSGLNTDTQNTCYTLYYTVTYNTILMHSAQRFYVHFA